MIKTKFTLILFVVVLLVSCSRVPITNRKQFKMLPDNMMMSMSISNYKGFLSKNPVVPTNC